VELYLHSPNKPPWRGAQLRNEQGKLCLYLNKKYFLVVRIWFSVSMPSSVFSRSDSVLHAAISNGQLKVIQRWNGLLTHDVDSKFHENLSNVSKVIL
jgi:hypothetical protein